MKVLKFNFEIDHDIPINVRVRTDYYKGVISLHALCPIAGKWQAFSQQELGIYEQIGALLAQQ